MLSEDLSSRLIAVMVNVSTFCLKGKAIYLHQYIFVWWVQRFFSVWYSIVFRCLDTVAYSEEKKQWMPFQMAHAILWIQILFLISKYRSKSGCRFSKTANFFFFRFGLLFLLIPNTEVWIPIFVVLISNAVFRYQNVCVFFSSNCRVFNSEIRLLFFFNFRMSLFEILISIFETECCFLIPNSYFRIPNADIWNPNAVFHIPNAAITISEYFFSRNSNATIGHATCREHHDIST